MSQKLILLYNFPALQHGVKGLAMRLRINFKDATGQAVTDQAEVSSFPAGL